MYKICKYKSAVEDSLMFSLSVKGLAYNGSNGVLYMLKLGL